MGYGSYSHEAHVAITQARQKLPQQQVFKQTKCHPLMNPHGVKFRESRDSAEHPNSIGILFALDVSGSMGEIPKQLATQTLPSFMKTLLEAGVTDPQILFMAVGNAVSDAAPLQVGQFESTEKLMDTWLVNMYLEGGGSGGNESYELAMYFAARHTDMDCVRKRNHKGYFFVTGDEPTNPNVLKNEVKHLIGDELDKDIPTRDIMRELRRSFEPFYLIPDPGRAGVKKDWEQYFEERVIVMPAPADTGYVTAALVALCESRSASLDKIIGQFTANGLAKGRAEAIAKAVEPFAKTLSR